MQWREIIFWKTESGRCPVGEYIGETQRKRRERARIMEAIEIVGTMQVVPTKILKKLKGKSGLWEIRVDQHRFLGFFATGDTLMLVSAFDKKTQKTPLQEIAVAEGRKRVYESKPTEKP